MTMVCSARSSRMAGSTEFPEDWLSVGNPWEFDRPEVEYAVGFGGTVDAVNEPDGAVRHVWHPAETVRRSPSTRRWSAGAGGTSTRCGCGRRGHPIRCSSTRSTAATMSARCPTGCAPRRSRRCSTRATRRRRARSCGCGRSISSSPRRCRTWCGAISPSMAARSPRCRTRRRSSSTTPIPRSRSPN